MKQKVLFVDNDKEFLETRVERLQEEGYQVYQATSSEEAEALLKDRWVHIAIIDIRLRDDTDQKDTSGLTLAKKQRYQPISKIILTRYATIQYVRQALGPTTEGLPAAVDFIDKAAGSQAMLDAVKTVFERHVRINWDLIIHWHALHSFHHLLVLITSESNNEESDFNLSHLLPDGASELEDLFRKLFAKSTQITINRCLYQAEGRVMLELSAYGDAGEQQLIVSCGRRDMMANEANNFEQFGLQNAAIGGIIRDKMIETTHFAATAYSLVECDLEQTGSFKEFYASHSTEQVQTALQHLFDVTLASWHKERRSYENHHKSLRDAYPVWLGVSDEILDQNAFEQRVQAICDETLRAGLRPLDYSAHMLTFHLADGESVFYANPTMLLSAQPFAHLPIIYGLTHGQVGASSVLVDQQGQTWLVDFTNARVGPLLRDWVSLELAIKFELLGRLGLHDRYKMETQLLANSDLDDISFAESTSPELKKALNAVKTLRHRAAQLPNYDHCSYLEGLFFCAVKYLLSYNPNLRYSGRNLLPYAHILLSTAMLSQKLIGGEQPNKLPAQAYQTLWIDQENKVIWVEGRQVNNLTPQEFNILLYLYQNEGKPCSRKEIFEHALSQKFDKRFGDGLLNAAVNRLRQKIEPDPPRRKYLITKRGFGYKLLLA